MKSLIYTAAGLMLASVALAGQATNPNKAKLMNPAGMTEQAPPTYTVNLEHEQRPDRDSSPPRLGAYCRGSILQPRQERVL